MIISDVHGKFPKYWELVKNESESLQLGDFGFKNAYEWYEKMNIPQHKILGGNHDYYPRKDLMIGDYGLTTVKGVDIFYVRGADSIDKRLRIEGRDWFREEELSIREMNSAIDLYEQIKPDLIVTHDCPQLVMEKLFGYKEKSVTRQGLQGMFEIHQPSFWIFGHHHLDLNQIINGTNFVCLGELKTWWFD